MEIHTGHYTIMKPVPPNLLRALSVRRLPRSHSLILASCNYDLSIRRKTPACYFILKILSPYLKQNFTECPKKLAITSPPLFTFHIQAELSELPANNTFALECHEANFFFWKKRKVHEFLQWVPPICILKSNFCLSRNRLLKFRPNIP